MNKPAKIRLALGIVTLILGIVASAYIPMIFADALHQDLPDRWSKVCTYTTLNQIYDGFGVPDENADGKGWQSYVRKQWWGSQILTITDGNYFKDTNGPRGDVYYGLVIKGLYQDLNIPIGTKILKKRSVCEPIQ